MHGRMHACTRHAVLCRAVRGPQASSFPIQQGVALSRATAHTFKHNDMRDLERLMVEVDAKARKEK